MTRSHLTHLRNLILLTLFFVTTAHAATAWQEDFNAPALDGKGATGGSTPTIDMDGVTKWSIDISSASLTATSDWFRVEGELFEGRDLDGPAVWETESIDISGLSNPSFSLEAAESGDHESSDYFDVYYSLDGGAFTLIPNWNGQGSGTHTLVGDIPDDGDWGTTTVTQAVAGNTLAIRVVMLNNAGTEYLRLDNVQVTDTTTLTPIYDIQYTAEASGDSPKLGEEVTTSGVVTAAFSDGYFIEDPAGGAWNGLFVYDNVNAPTRGDLVQVTGTVAEFNNLTELTAITAYTLVSSGNTLPAAQTLSTANVPQEQWEGVLIRVETLTVTNHDLGFGEWAVNDGSGDLRVDDKGSYTYTPVTGDPLHSVTGLVDYSFGNFKIQPRDDADITPQASLVINEIHADPAADLPGDANGDGTRDNSEDEFVEIVNNSIWDVDISGWTLADSTSVRHTFPAGTVIPSRCAVVVFGGGAPVGTFGHSLTQTASNGALGLNNGGDTVTLNDGTSDRVAVTYGTEGGDNQSLTRYPDITAPTFQKHAEIAASAGALFSPGTMVDGTAFAGCISSGYTPIYDIQYPPNTNGDSPLEGQIVTTEGIVTATFYSGYFIQDPSGGEWSGLWVHDAANVPYVGDRVRLTGTVAEYYNFTELDSITDFDVLSTANTIPAPQVLPTGDVAQERWEGVLVRVEAVTVTDDNLGFGEWSVSDGSGDVRVDDKGSYTYAPSNGDNLDAVTGPLDYAYGEFKIQPRDDGDIDTPTPVFINEVDAAQAGTDAAEFIELYDTGDGSTDLSGLVLVLFNGTDDLSYNAFDLDGHSTDSYGYFVLCGDSANVFRCDLDVSPNTNLLQNGPDAVALYEGDAADFPNGTPVTTVNLLDAIVYDTGDEDDAELLVLLNAGQPQVDEDAAEDADFHSNQRFPNGSGGLRNTDTYGQEFPTPGVANFRGCGNPATLIHTVQGSGDSSPMEGQAGVALEGVVVGDFQDTTSELSGFFLQEEDSDIDADPATSEGIFVFDNGFGVDVNVGDVVRVIGEVTEYYGFTELSGVGNVAVCSSGGIASPAVVALPIASPNDWERYEGMSIAIPHTLYATDNYAQGRDGEVILSVGDRLYTPTNVTAPGASANAYQDVNDRSQILLDDGSKRMFPAVAPYIGADDTLRVGDTLPGLNGVLAYGYGAYRIHPTGAVNFTRANVRALSPTGVGGTLRVASFNVLNYFTTIDTGAAICGPLANEGCRGADSADEFNRQREKIIPAILALNADVIGLMEVENNGYGPASAIQNLVDGLNAAAPAGTTYAFVNPGTAYLGSDVISVGLIYRTETVTPIGAAATLTVAPFLDTNRSPLAQTFEEIATGGRFTAAVNHFKSKGSCPDSGPNADLGDGQACWNSERTLGAGALSAWLATDPTSSGDPDFLILGDLNSYAQEDPITALKAAGYINLVELFNGARAYSYVHYGQAGTLDHALANPALAGQVAGVSVWHINADEPRALDYNDFNQDALYKPHAYRSSDHDPVLIGLDLAGGGVPEIDVQGNGNPIPDGDVTPSTTDDTDFGYAAITGGSVEHTFTISNTGDGALLLDGTPIVDVTGPNAADFTVTSQPSAAVSGGGGVTTFTVRFAPSMVGTRSASLVIANNDSDENPYNFDIQGHGQEGEAIGIDGGIFSDGRWSVSVPPGAVPDGSTIFMASGLTDVGPPVGGGLQALGDILEAHIYNASGTELHDFNLSLDVCFEYTQQDVVAAGGKVDNFNMATAPDGAAAWTLLTTVMDEANNRVCAEVVHFSYFEVMYPTLPETGFAPNRVTRLPQQPSGLVYEENAGVQLYIPQIDLRETIVSVPFGDGGWDVRWLGDGIGYLEGTAFPTWAGNTALTGHVYLADGTPGPFVNLSSLRWGDEIYVYAWGERYTYRVQSVEFVAPGDVSVLRHEDYDTLTLLTCQGYDEGLGAYRWRVVVRAVRE